MHEGLGFHSQLICVKSHLATGPVSAGPHVNKSLTIWGGGGVKSPKLSSMLLM